MVKMKVKFIKNSRAVINICRPLDTSMLSILSDFSDLLARLGNDIESDWVMINMFTSKGTYIQPRELHATNFRTAVRSQSVCHAAPALCRCRVCRRESRMLFFFCGRVHCRESRMLLFHSKHPRWKLIYTINHSDCASDSHLRVIVIGTTTYDALGTGYYYYYSNCPSLYKRMVETRDVPINRLQSALAVFPIIGIGWLASENNRYWPAPIIGRYLLLFIYFPSWILSHQV